MTTTVPLILNDTDKDMPLIVTSRWLEWLYAPCTSISYLAQNEALLSGLVEKFGEFTGTESHPYKEPGDPRNAFTGSNNESIFLAIRKGELGVLTEAETMYVPFDKEEQVEEDGCLYLPEAQFNQKVKEYSEEIIKILEKYPKTFFCLASNDNTCMNRLCLMAFTPLKKNSELEYVSSYTETYPDNTISLIDEEINEIICRI
ncbi:hypothetical protein [Vibrio parahaemolyticus]|uniref:hypothetical protein n=1 Tax=Vibrio parahaemolyticus TaxID=670 RepID=UPI00226A6D9F|nr:hypothetical protein [Vibrio parahaemolyticus]MCX8795785.1 hypothetical protein [Vibrio parahaemolyticus]